MSCAVLYLYGFFAVIMLMIGFSVWSFFIEKRQWNGGISPSGEKWQPFDMDSYESRGYTDSKRNVIWISFNRIDGGYNDKN